MAYNVRTVQRANQDSQLRIMICIHTPKNVPSMLNLLEATHPTKKSPLSIFVLHLLELAGRASAMLIAHNNRKTGRSSGLSRTQAQSDHIIGSFENFEKHKGSCVTVNPLTAISPYSTMHEDICTLAEDKHIAFIIIPFHKLQTVDGGLETMTPALRTVNQNLLANAPCSVAVFVDRGFGASRTQTMVAHRVALLFFGGPDDREALTYATRMCEEEGTCLTMMRFVAGEKALSLIRNNSTSSTNSFRTSSSKTLTVEVDDDAEKKIDEDLVQEFRSKFMNSKSIVYTEKVVNNSEETVGALRSIVDNTHELFIVGRGQGTLSYLTAGLTDWSECPELGPIGDLLASSDFAASVSVLVVQQYVGEGIMNEVVADVPDDRDNFMQTKRDKAMSSP